MAPPVGPGPRPGLRELRELDPTLVELLLVVLPWLQLL